MTRHRNGTAPKLTRRAREQRAAARLTEQIETAYEREHQSKRYTAAELRRRLAVPWERLAFLGIGTNAAARRDVERRYPIRLVKEALDSAPLPPIRAETVTAYAVRNPDGSVLKRFFDPNDAALLAGVWNSGGLPKGGLYRIEPITVEIHATD